MIALTLLALVTTAAERPADPRSAAQPVPIATTDPFGGDALADDELLQQNGRQDTLQEARNAQVASTSNNQVNGASKTGAVGFADQAFQNISGLTIVNANSGNNVAMNVAMNVSISISPEN